MRTRTRLRPRSLLGFWIVAAIAQLAGDASLYLGARTLRDSVPGLELGVGHLTGDSLHHAVARYLRDSLGATTTRHNDTMVVTIPPGARHSAEADLSSVSSAARQASGWLVAAVLLLHAPLLLAIVVTVLTVRARAREEENRALQEWEEER